MTVKNDLYDYGLIIYQDNEKFKFSLDSLLLAEYIETKNKKTLLDLCTGNAPLPMIIANKTEIQITGIEIQKSIYDLAVKSIAENGLGNKITMINDTAKNAKNYFPGNNFDIITCNPPFFKQDSSLKNENYEKAIARHEITITLKELIEIASYLLKNNGEFYLVHRPERLEEIITLCSKNNLRIKKMTFISSKEEEPAIMVLIKCVKNARIGMKVDNKIINRETKTYQNIWN